MTGVCVEGYVQLVQNTSDLDGIAMRVLGEACERIEIFEFLILLVKEEEGCRGESFCADRLLVFEYLYVSRLVPVTCQTLTHTLLLEPVAA